MERMAHVVVARLAEYRRLVAAGLAGLGTLAAINAVSSSREFDHVLAASRDLPSGHVITASDVTTVRVAHGDAPRQQQTQSQVVGMRTAGPMRSGELLTDYRLASAQALTGYGDDLVLTTVRVDAADGAAAARPGDVIDVVASGSGSDDEHRARVVAKSVQVVAVDEHEQWTTFSVATTQADALALADAALTARFSVLTPTGSR